MRLVHPHQAQDEQTQNLISLRYNPHISRVTVMVAVKVTVSPSVPPTSIPSRLFAVNEQNGCWSERLFIDRKDRELIYLVQVV